MQTSKNTTMETLNLTFAYSTSTVTNPFSKNQAINLAEMVSIIKDTVPTSSYKSISDITITGLNKGRNIKDIKAEIAPLKTNLPFFLFSGYQAVGHNNKDLQYNGVVQLDFDAKEEFGDQIALTVKESLSKLPYVILAGISPSGVGVKALIRTSNLDKANHLNALKEVIEKVSNDINMPACYFDVVGASQPVYLFIDNQVFVNEQADTFNIVGSFSKKVSTFNIKKPSKKCLQNSKFNFSTLTKTQVDKALKIAYNSACKRRGSIVDTTFLQSYAGSTITFGVEYKDAYNYLITKGHSLDMTDKRSKSLNDMYNLYSDSFGTAEVSYNIENIKYSVNDSFKLQADQMLSDLDLDLSVNSIIQSPTGSGKSFYVGSKLEMNRVMVVPTQSLVKQFAQEYAACPFYADAKELTNRNFIVTTYKSFSNLCKLINISDYTLFVDEAHNTSSSTSHTFLLKELNEVVDLLGNFKNFHLLTATPLFNFHPTLNNLKLINVTKPSTITKVVHDIRYSDFYKTLQDGVQDTVNKDGQFVVLSNNTDETTRLGRIQACLNNFNTVTINATKKDDDSFIEIAIDGDMSKCQGIIATTVIKEGNSITKHAKLINIFVDGNFHPAELNQFASRFRVTTEVNIYLMKSDKSTDGFCSFSLTEACEEVANLAKQHASLRNSIESSKYVMKEQLRVMNDLDKFYFRRVDGKIVEDYLAMSNVVFNLEKDAANTDFDYMAEYMKRFDWVSSTIVNNTTVMTEEDKQVITNIVELNKSTKKLHIEAIMNQLSTESIWTNESIIESNTITDKVEKDIRYKVSVIANYSGDKDIKNAITMLDNITLSKQAWTSFTKAINIQKLRTKSDFISNTNNELSNYINDVYNTFNVGSSYSSDELQSMLNIILDKHFPVKSNVTKTKANQILNTFFTLTRKSVRANGKVVHNFVITNDNPTNLTINTDLYIKTKQEEFDFCPF